MATTFRAVPYGDAFTRAEEYLAKGRDKHNRPLVNNTRMVRVHDNAIAIVLHSTAVVTYHATGEFTIYGGGWNTVTTKDRIRTYSPAYPCSDGSGGWIVGHTGEITPPRVQKCRSCKGRGRWMAEDYCWGPRSWMQSEPVCAHGETSRHRTGESERVCHRCEGAGRTDYGSKPVPIVLSASVPFLVDAEGTFLQVTDAPGYTGSGYPAPKPKSKPSPHNVGASLVDDLARAVPNVRATVRHPVSGGENTLDRVIVSLNDGHQWSRERIADWLETLDVDLRFTS